MEIILMAEAEAGSPLIASIFLVTCLVGFMALVIYVFRVHLEHLQHYRKNVDRHREHVERVEEQMVRVEAILERIAAALETRIHQ